MNLEMIKAKRVQMILQFSIPSIIAMVLTSLITIVDGLFIGNYVGEEGIAAVNLGLPILYIYLGIGIMVSVGGISIAGRALGAKNIKMSVDVFNQTVVFSILVSVILSVIVLLLFQPIMSVLPMNEKVTACFREYYQVMIWAYPIMILNSTMGMFMRGEGKPQRFMMINVLTVISNIVLDYVFVGLLHYGVSGAAIASLLSLVLGAACMLFFFLKQSDVYKFRKFKFSKIVLRDTLSTGSAEFIGQISMSISMFAYNGMILTINGPTGVAAFSIVGYIAYLFGMVIVGFGQGASPLISFAYGAREKELSISLRKITNVMVFVSGAVVILALWLGASWYSRMFVDNATVVNLVQTGLSIFVLSFLPSGINTITTFYFTSIGYAKESAMISASRGLVVLLICIVTLPRFFGMTGIWLVAPITEGITIVLTGFLLWRNGGFLWFSSGNRERIS